MLKRIENHKSQKNIIINQSCNASDSKAKYNDTSILHNEEFKELNHNSIQNVSSDQMNINSGYNSIRRDIQDKSKEEIKDDFAEFDAIHKYKPSKFNQKRLNFSNDEISVESSNSSFHFKEFKPHSLINPNAQLRYNEIEYNSSSERKSNEECSDRNKSLIDIISKIQKNG